MPSTQDILDLKVGQRQSRFRWDLYDKAGHKIGELNPDMGTTPQIDNVLNRTVKRQLSNLVLPPSDWSHINFASDRLRPYMVLENTQAWPLGEFLFADASRNLMNRGRHPTVGAVRPITPKTLGVTNRGEYVQINAMPDKCLILNQPLAYAWGFVAGQRISDILGFILSQAVPSLQVEIGPTNQVMGTAGIGYPMGKNLMSMLTEIAALAGFASPWFDNNGVLQIQPYPDQAKRSQLRYDRSTGSKVILNSASASSNILDIPNRYIVISSDANNVPITATYDIPADNPMSERNRGYVVAQTIDKQGLTDNEQAMQVAMDTANSTLQVVESVTFSGFPDPRHDSFQIVSWENVNHREYAWSMPCVEGGEMVHSLHRGGTTWGADDLTADQVS